MIPMPGRGNEEIYFIGHDEWANERGNGPLEREGVLEKRSFERLIYKLTTHEKPLAKLPGS